MTDYGTPCTCRRCSEEDVKANPREGVAAPFDSRVNRMFLCPTCGNKRCPHAAFHGNACTNSNAPGQPGSDYEWQHMDLAPRDGTKLDLKCRTVLGEKIYTCHWGLCDGPDREGIYGWIGYPNADAPPPEAWRLHQPAAASSAPRASLDSTLFVESGEFTGRLVIPHNLHLRYDPDTETLALHDGDTRVSDGACWPLDEREHAGRALRAAIGAVETVGRRRG